MGFWWVCRVALEEIGGMPYTRYRLYQKDLMSLKCHVLGQAKMIVATRR